MGVLTHMAAGDLIHVVTINSRVVTNDADGGWSPGITEVAAGVRASIQPIRGREFWNKMQVQSDATFRIMLRYDSRFSTWNPDYQIVWGSRTFEAVGPVKNLDERGITLEILAKEVAA